MAVDVVMPKLGLTMTEGTISKWLKQDGEKVEKGEPLLEVTTDKITNEVEAPASGVIKIFVNDGKTARVSEVIGAIAGEGENVVPPKGEKEVNQVDHEGATTTQQQQRPKDTRIKASPAARKMAKAKGIALTEIEGTGPGGRIVEKNVLNYLEKVSAAAKIKTTPVAEKIAADLEIDLHDVKGSGVAGRVMKVDVEKAATPKTHEKAEILPLSGMRKIIAENMTASKRTAPHVTINMEVDMFETFRLREKLIPVIETTRGIKISFTDIIVKVTALALKKFPIINASIIEDKIVKHPEVNVGVAVALDNGLIVPVIKNTDKKSIGEISASVKDLAQRARDNRLTPDEISGGTFTITNLGMYGVDSFNPIINQPESAILGVNRIVKKPVVREDQMVIRPMMTLSLSFDHRLIDGSLAAQFLKALKGILENPYLLLS